MIKKLLLAAGLTLAASAASAVTVLGTAAVYGAGVGGSTAPVSVALGGDTVFNITATGFTNCCFGTPNANADGASGQIGSGNTAISGAFGVSGITVSGRQMFLAGVFVDSSALPTTGSGPAPLIYTPGDLGFAAFAPLLNQTFFIGDGLTGVGTGALQEFAAPIGADTLLLGFVDGFGFSGSPAAYGDNTGSLEATVSAVAAVPLPAGLPLALAGLGLFGLMARRKA